MISHTTCFLTGMLGSVPTENFGSVKMKMAVVEQIIESTVLLLMQREYM